MRRENGIRKGLNRLLVLVLAAAITMAFSFTGVFADDTGGGSGTTGGQVTASKEITDTKVDKTTGKPTYTIKLSVSGTPYTKTTETPGKANVVLVLDKSGSMADKIKETCGSKMFHVEYSWLDLFHRHPHYVCNNCGQEYRRKPSVCNNPLTRMNVAKTAAKSFIDQILPEGSKNQLAVVAFDGNNGGTNDRDVIQSTSLTSSAEKEKLNAFVNGLKAEGGTNYTAALSKAQEILKGSKIPSYIVFISDGNPGKSGESYDDPHWNGSSQAESLKNAKNARTTIFSVGIGDQINSKARTALKNIASADAEGNPHFTEISDSNLAEKLPNILEGLANDINTQTVSAGNNAVLTDGVNTDKFNLVPKSLSDGVSEKNGTLTWQVGSIPENVSAPAEKFVTFKVTPKDDAYGECHTNTSVNLEYNDGLTGDSKTVSNFGNPTVKLYKVVYLKDDVNVLESYGGLASLDRHPEPETNPTKTNCTFKKWDEGTVSKDGYVKTFKPIFEENKPTSPTKYTVTYHSDNKVVKTEDIDAGNTTAAPANLQKDGYHLDGWYTNDSYTGDKYDFRTPVNNNLDLYAKWVKDEPTQPTKYTVKYHIDGEVVKNEDVEVGKTTTAPADLQKDGYHLDGWYTNDSYTGDKYDFTTPVNDNLNLYAKWVKDEPTPPTEKYTVTYTDGVPNEEIFKDQVTSNILTGSKTPAFSGTLTRSGYTFAGWTPEVEKTVTKDITYTATWTKNNTPTTPTTPVTPTPSEEHKVTITPNNGDPDITQTVPDGGKAVEPDDLTNDGYKLDGWYTDSTMTQPFDFSQPIKSDIHIYAKWTKTNEPVTPAKPSKKVSGILLPKVIAKGKHTQMLTWTALKNVDGYFIYTNHCDEGKKLHPFKKVADYKASKARVYTKKNLKTYHNYKYYVAAYKIKNGKKVIVRNSVTVHSVCGNTSARSTNVKSVKVSKHAVTLKKGQIYKVKATISKMNKKRAFLDATHCGLLRYLTADSNIATVNYKTGMIKAKKAGKTTVYVLGVNGIRDKVTVTVK